VEIDDAVKVFAEGGRTALLKKDGSLWMCGNNILGGLGNGEEYTGGGLYNPFTKIMDDVTDVAMGLSYSVAIKTDSSLWAWGWNDFGQLGDGTVEIRFAPFKLMEDVSTAAAYGHTIVIKKDNSLWAWGSNSLGQFGNGTTISSLVPIEIKISEPEARAVNPTASSVLVNGSSKAFEAYLIDGNNFFKLRDLAMVVSGTEKQFAVGWDGTTKEITLTSGQPYTLIGGEMTQSDGKEKTATLNTNINISLDGTSVVMTAYLIGGNNFIRLRDIMRLLDIGVTWDGVARTIVIDTSNGYTE